MNVRQIRVGELLALAGAGCVIASLFTFWYESPAGNLDAWNTFGPSMALLIAAACAALAVVVTALTERSSALPVSAAVWCVALGLAGVIAAVVRVLERPDHATALCIGPWLALVGAVAILLGAWLALRDERSSLYPPASPQRRPAP
jgi:hypothetical protein